MLNMILQVLAACFGTIAFSIFFRVRAKHFPTCGGIGAMAWVVYLLVNRYADNTVMAVLAASATVVLLSRFYSVRHKCPLITYLVPGLFPLVPGTGIYYTVLSMINGYHAQALVDFTNAFKAAFAIAVAITVGVTIPTEFFVEINAHFTKMCLFKKK